MPRLARDAGQIAKGEVDFVMVRKAQDFRPVPLRDLSARALLLTGNKPTRDGRLADSNNLRRSRNTAQAVNDEAGGKASSFNMGHDEFLFGSDIAKQKALCCAIGSF